MPNHLIRNATLVDGTGAPARPADVVIEAGRIAEIANPGSAPNESDLAVTEADGLLLTPGFVDPHTHYDGQATWDDRIAPSVDHGVTTVVIGNCGVGFAPVRADQKNVLIDLMEGVEDIPGVALHDGIQWDWESFPEYLDALEKTPRSVEIAAQLPHGSLRTYVLGEGAGSEGHDVNRAARPEEIKRMAELAREAAEAGAIAFSSNRITMHTSTGGEAVPGTFAEATEVNTILSAMRDGGSAVFQVVPAGLMGEDPDGFRREIDFYQSVSLESEATVLYTIAQNNVQPQLWQELFDKTDAANSAGARLVPMTINRPGGMLLSWETFHPFLDRPSFLEVATLPFEKRVEALRDPKRRARVLAEPIASPMYQGAYEILVNSLGAAFRPGTPGGFEPDPALSLARQIEECGEETQAFLYDALCDAAESPGGPAFISVFMGNYAEGNLDAVAEMIQRPGTLVGGGDGGAHVTVICDASYPTYMLEHWVRDRQRGERIELEAAIQMLTQAPAALHGMHDRGVIERGKRADLNLIDLDQIHLDSPRVAYDLPTGAPRLLQSAKGYRATFVGGEITQRDGADTGARPGGLFRG